MNLAAKVNAIPPTLIPLSPGKRPEIPSSNPYPLQAVRGNVSIISPYGYVGETTPMKINKARITMEPTAISGLATIVPSFKESHIGQITPLIEFAGHWGPVITADTTPDLAGIYSWGEPQVLVGGITLDLMTTSAAEFVGDTSSVFFGASVLGVPAPDLLPTWLGNLTSRIRRFSSLQSNWDSYRGKPISLLAIERAVTVASLLAGIVSRKSPLTEQPFAAPTSLGGVLFEIKNGNRELHVEIEPGTSKYGIYRISSESPDELEESVTESQLSEVLSWIVNTR